MIRFFICTWLLALPLASIQAKQANSGLMALYNSLDPLSISQHLAFYELYQETPEGKKALAHIWSLLQGKNGTTTEAQPLPFSEISSFVGLITRQPQDKTVHLTAEQLTAIDRISNQFPHRTLRGHGAWSEEEILELKPEEVDLARGLLIYQFAGIPNINEEIQQYEARLDLMALQISARLPKHASNEDKIREINRFIFQEMEFRFPPHSLHAKDIDLYTFLPSVMDSRQGVCLGVSILYLCLAQRLDLPLDILTPPGHIFLSYSKGERVINIETTARGIHMPIEVYLGVNTRKLSKRNIKEVIGMAFFNQASVYWQRQDHLTAVALYEKAQKFMSDDPLLKMLLGLNYLFIGKKREGKNLLRSVPATPWEDEVSVESVAADYLSGRVDVEGLKATFLHVNETRESIIEKQRSLEKTLARYPNFRAGIFQLATTWLQLGRGQEAQTILERYHALDQNDVTVEYYLSVLCIRRFDYPRAWKFLKNAEAIAAQRDHHPEALRAVRQELRRHYPEKQF